MKPEIKNIIFDFGDIFINLDKEAPLKGIYHLDPNFELDRETLNVNELYEQGKLSTPQFIAHYNKKLPGVSQDDLTAVWNSIICDLPGYRIDFLEKLSREHPYRLFLLSNTNELHIQQVIKNTGLPAYNRFRNLFEKFYLSHEIGLRKPNHDIYQFVLTENKLDASQTLFIDDLSENTRAAAELGIHVWNLTPGKDDITEIFTKNLPL